MTSFTRLTLVGSRADLWWIRPGTVTDPAELARCRDLLTDDELEKTDRFRLASDRHTCLITRVLLRTTLSRYCAVSPTQWRFRTNSNGRPEINYPPSSIRFNLSHTSGLIVCLVSRSREVGVDVESLGRAVRWLDLSERFFAAREVAAIRRVEESERSTRFLQHWALKESYVKARGLGLTIPLTGFSFDLLGKAADEISVRFTSVVSDDPGRWQFTLKQLGHSHIVATAVERTGPEPVRITLREAVALLG